MIKNKYVWTCKNCGYQKVEEYLPREKCPSCGKELPGWAGQRQVINKEIE